MFTGMLDAVADIHQLTFVLGHEMAHALLAHSVSALALFVTVALCLVLITSDITVVSDSQSQSSLNLKIFFLSRTLKHTDNPLGCFTTQ